MLLDVSKPPKQRMKQGFQMALHVVFCLWIIYQIKHSHGEQTDYVYSEAQDNPSDLKHSATNFLGHKSYGKPSDTDEIEANKNEDNEISINPNQGEVGRGFVAFPDENGVPPDGYQLRSNSDEIEAITNEEDENSLNPDQGEIVHGFVEFPDENGVPQDGQYETIF